MIFLSDGECPVPDTSIQDLCHSAIRLGSVIVFFTSQVQWNGLLVPRKPLSFHSVSFGPDSTSTSLRRMAQLALQIQNNAPRDRGHATSIPSAFTAALDTVSIRYNER